MTDLKLRKAQPTRLRDAGFGEAWLQQEIAKDPSLLGLGELQVIQREKLQPPGGRIDFLMYDPEAETRYEIELMLGAVDESHIIRTIEYWDIERQRFPTLEHRAVIVAEEITARFFNVIRLLNRAVPIIAIQLSAFVLDGNIVLHFTRVLDTWEFADENTDEPPSEQADRAYWEKRANRESLEVFDSLVALVPTGQGAARVTYNRGHLAVGTSGFNLLWSHPRRSAHLNLHLKVPVDQRPGMVEKLEAAGIDAASRGRSQIRLQLTKKDVSEKQEALAELLRVAEEWSRR